MKSIETKWNQVKSSEIKWNQVTPNEMNSNQVKWYETHMNSSEAKWNQLSPHPLPPILLSNFSWPYRYTYIYIDIYIILCYYTNEEASRPTYLGGLGGGKRINVLCYIVLDRLTYIIVQCHILSYFPIEWDIVHRHNNIPPTQKNRHAQVICVYEFCI